MGPKSTQTRLKLADLEPNPKNPNVTDEATLQKIENNIRRTGMCPPIIVRPKKKGVIKPPFIILDGFHRWTILKRLDWQECDVQVWDVTEREGDIALATINRLHGTDDLKLRASLVYDLVEVIPVDQLAQMLPENQAEIEDLMKLTQVDLDALERLQTEQVERNDAETPAAFSVILFPKQRAIVEQALDHIKAREGLDQTKNADGNALEYLAAEYIAAAVMEAREEASQAGASPIGGGGEA